jgi:hypothetical protein
MASPLLRCAYQYEGTGAERGFEEHGKKKSSLEKKINRSPCRR